LELLRRRIAATHFSRLESLEQRELVAFADPVAPVLERVAKEHGISKTYEKPADLIDDPDIDIIDICTPSAYTRRSQSRSGSGQTRHLRKTAGAYARRYRQNDRGPR
jgi:hypothetical protein